MKKMILKWLGLQTIVADVQFLENNTDKAIKDLVRDSLDDVKHDIQSDVKYELEDEFASKEDVLSEIEGALENNNFQELFDKVQRIDDRLVELVAGYKLEVQLVKEEY